MKKSFFILTIIAFILALSGCASSTFQSQNNYNNKGSFHSKIKM
jgi:outer membrane lipoprotein SlyB